MGRRLEWKETGLKKNMLDKIVVLDWGIGWD